MAHLQLYDVLVLVPEGLKRYRQIHSHAWFHLMKQLLKLAEEWRCLDSTVLRNGCLDFQSTKFVAESNDFYNRRTDFEILP